MNIYEYIGVTLDGAMTGIEYYLTPQWHRLQEMKVLFQFVLKVAFIQSVSNLEKSIILHILGILFHFFLSVCQ